MDIARAFTTRRNKHVDSTPTPALPARVSTAIRRTSNVPISRRKISAPIALISTTNMLSYNAPNIRSSSSSSTSDSDHSPSHSSSISISLDSPPRSPVGPNHLSIYFPPSGRLYSASNHQSEDVPPVPLRAFSHTRKSHMLAHRRSQKRASPPNLVSSVAAEPTLTRSTSPASSTGIDQPAHPFGKELKQVNELVEEFNSESGEEELMMQKKGLRKFLAEEYLTEIEDLFGGVFEDQLPVLGAGWI